MKREWREEILEFFEEIAPDAYHIDDAAYMLHVKGPGEMDAYFHTMDALLREGKLETKDGVHYTAVVEKPEILYYEGVYKRYRAHFGFVVDTEIGDIFIPVEHAGVAMNNDCVRVRLTVPAKGAKNAQGAIVDVLERMNTKIVGTFQREKHFGFVIPDDERIGGDIYVEIENSLDARSSAKVLVEITHWPDDAHRRPEGKITQILGYKGTPGLDVSCIVAKHEVPSVFPEAVLEEASRVPQTVTWDPKRLDLRNTVMITIDGEDAKDLDDAVSLERLPNGNFYLGVHIADVSHYVRAFSPLDKEAYKRGTSVYLVDRVIPMLPPELSNGICSLNAHVDRYAMSCMMEITPMGKVVKYTIKPSMIHIDRRCNYTEVYKALTQDIIPEDLEPFMPLLRELQELMEVLYAMRIRRGALDFDFPEYKVMVNEEGTPLRIVKRDRTLAERIIEECMLIANETVAMHLSEKAQASVYRIHETPKDEKLDMVKRIMQYLGKPVQFDEEAMHPKHFQKLLEEVSGTDIEQVAQMMVLRAMQQAKYTVPNKGHFGLASTCYTHFTSPIRRYPDLMVHRLLKAVMHWPDGHTKRDVQEDFLSKAVEHSSQAEQRAVETEREVSDLKKAEYMVPFVGQSFEAKISSITSFGMFVSLDNGVDGLVSIAAMDDDFYMFDEEHFVLVGRHRGQTYHLGQTVTVTLVNVDVGRSQIDFVLGDVDPATLTYRKRIAYGKEPEAIGWSRDAAQHRPKGMRRSAKGGRVGGRGDREGQPRGKQSGRLGKHKPPRKKMASRKGRRR